MSRLKNIKKRIEELKSKRAVLTEKKKELEITMEEYGINSVEEAEERSDKILEEINRLEAQSDKLVSKIEEKLDRIEK